MRDAMTVMARLELIVAVAACLACGCASSSGGAAHRAPPRASIDCDEFGDRPSFALDRAALLANRVSARLVPKLDASVYRYFRMLAPEFSARACAGVADQRWRLPLVAVHGDAHVAQFVVTTRTYGLEDFDQAGFGPAVVDIVRYAASLHVACREVPFSPCGADRAVDVYFQTYRESLDHAAPVEVPPVPSVVERLRGSAPQDRVAWLAWAQSLMQPVAPDVDAFIRQRWPLLARQIAEVEPGRSPRFCESTHFGALEMGVGSLLEKKLLLRVRGETDDPTDDIIIEARSTPTSTGRGCAWRPRHGGALHSLMMMSILGRRMPGVYGFGGLSADESAPQFYVQSWEQGYHELSIGDIRSQVELEELAADAAHQLAGHFWTRFPDALRAQQRVAQLEAFDSTIARARTLSKELASEVVREWQRFRGQVPTP